MKAIIMAGGEGTRLRPISCLRPKPMTPLMDVPVLEHVINLLKKCGIRDICLTLRCMSEEIIRFLESRESELGVHISYKIEDSVLGTAGSVRACTDFIGDDNFIVISGDGICDFDLNPCIAAHRENGADATLVLYSHPEPTEFGLVLTAPDGRIERFLEKPGWDNVLTDLINTGIYILSPDILRLIPENSEYDFGKNLFPQMLESGKKLYGIQAAGYWCDIGSPSAFLDCSRDALDGKIKLSLKAPEISPGIRCASSLPDNITLIPPVYIGEGCIIEAGAKIGPYAVIGSRSHISQGADVSGSVIFSASVCENAVIAGSVICSGVTAGSGAEISGGCVVGDGCRIGDMAVVSGGAYIWPDADIISGSVVHSNVTASGKREVSFSAGSLISGSAGAVITPEICIRLGAAAGKHGNVGICHDDNPVSELFAGCISCGAAAAGGNAYNLDCPTASCLAFSAREFSFDYSVFVSENHGTLSLAFFGKNGFYLSHDDERRLLSCREMPSGAGRPGMQQNITGTKILYTSAVLHEAACKSTRSPLRVCVPGTGSDSAFMRRILHRLGCTVTKSIENGIPAFTVFKSGMSATAVTESGKELSWEKLRLIAAMTEFEAGAKSLALTENPLPSFEELAGKYGVSLLYSSKNESDKGYHDPFILSDAVFCIARICSYVMNNAVPLDALAEKTPSPCYFSQEVPLSCDRGRIMRLLHESDSAFSPDCSGLRINTARGWVNISPLREKRAVLIRSESSDAEIAEELCAEYESITRALSDDKKQY